MLSTLTILDAIFDKKVSDIFKNVASIAGLVKRQNGGYLLTEFGKVIHFAYADLEAMIEKTIDNYWKLKAIDALDISSKEQRNRIVCALVDNPEIRSILMLEEPPSSLTKSKPHDTKLKSLVFPSI